MRISKAGLAFCLYGVSSTRAFVVDGALGRVSRLVTAKKTVKMTRTYLSSHEENDHVDWVQQVQKTTTPQQRIVQVATTMSPAAAAAATAAQVDDLVAQWEMLQELNAEHDTYGDDHQYKHVEEPRAAHIMTTPPTLPRRTLQANPANVTPWSRPSSSTISRDDERPQKPLRLAKPSPTKTSHRVLQSKATTQRPHGEYMGPVLEYRSGSGWHDPIAESWNDKELLWSVDGELPASRSSRALPRQGDFPSVTTASSTTPFATPTKQDENKNTSPATVAQNDPPANAEIVDTVAKSLPSPLKRKVPSSDVTVHGATNGPPPWLSANIMDTKTDAASSTKAPDMTSNNDPAPESVPMEPFSSTKVATNSFLASTETFPRDIPLSNPEIAANPASHTNVKHRNQVTPIVTNNEVQELTEAWTRRNQDHIEKSGMPPPLWSTPPSWATTTTTTEETAAPVAATTFTSGTEDNKPLSLHVSTPPLYLSTGDDNRFEYKTEDDASALGAPTSPEDRATDASNDKGIDMVIEKTTATSLAVDQVDAAVNALMSTSDDDMFTAADQMDGAIQALVSAIEDMESASSLETSDTSPHSESDLDLNHSAEQSSDAPKQLWSREFAATLPTEDFDLTMNFRPEDDNETATKKRHSVSSAELNRSFDAAVKSSRDLQRTRKLVAGAASTLLAAFVGLTTLASVDQASTITTQPAAPPSIDAVIEPASVGTEDHAEPVTVTTQVEEKPFSEAEAFQPRLTGDVSET